MHKACLITIGDEILIGQITDTNSGWLSQYLGKLGIQVGMTISIGDDQTQIVDTLKQQTDKFPLVITTGGLGPTKDDITKKAIASFLQVPLVFHEESYNRILNIFKKLDRPVSETHKEQCFLPEGVEILPNSMGTAPGMLFQAGKGILVSLPGVPFEMMAIAEESLKPILSQKFTNGIILTKTILVAGVGETEIEDRITSIISTMPKHLSIAYLPALGQVRLRLTITGSHDRSSLEKALQQFTEKICDELGDLVFGYDESNLETEIGKLCQEKSIKIGTIESCTGGKIAHRIVSVSGASSYFEGSIISYSNRIKNQVVGIPAEILSKHGAVSETTVKEMVKRGCALLGVDVVVAVSGIAGPTGGSPEKPVGTIWLAVGNETEVTTMLYKAGKNRAKNIELAAQAGLNLLRKFLHRQ